MAILLLSRGRRRLRPELLLESTAQAQAFMDHVFEFACRGWRLRRSYPRIDSCERVILSERLFSLCEADLNCNRPPLWFSSSLVVAFRYDVRIRTLLPSSSQTGLCF